MRNCHNCGFQIGDDTKFCPSCGTEQVLKQVAQEHQANVGGAFVAAGVAQQAPQNPGNQVPQAPQGGAYQQHGAPQAPQGGAYQQPGAPQVPQGGAYQQHGGPQAPQGGAYQQPGAYQAPQGGYQGYNGPQGGFQGQGSPYQNQQYNPGYGQGQQYGNTVKDNDFTQFSPGEAENGKLMGVLSYLGILVLIPIFAEKENRFVKFHANQGLVLLIAYAVYYIVYRLISRLLLEVAFGLYLLTRILGLLSIFFLVLAIIGIVNVVKGRAKKLPIIGGYTILK
ncbi:MAG: zinc-ribbon domain-containing protein [Tissierellia bacterium]|nr:zinc-ribbon domain-containing protein [Tissierellia bacterium]